MTLVNYIIALNVIGLKNKISYYLRGFSLFLTILSSFILLPLNAQAQLREGELSKIDEEGNWMGKFKFGGSVVSPSYDFKVNGVKQNIAGNSKDFVGSGVYAEAELLYKLSDRFSFTTSLGYLPNDKTQVTFTSSSGSGTDEGGFTFYPATAGIQFNIAPYGRLRPYIGAGYHYSLINNDFNKIKADSSTNGLMFSGGMDYWMDKKWGFSLEAKKYFMGFDIDTTKLVNINSGYDFTYDPLIFMVGLNYRFDNK